MDTAVTQLYEQRVQNFTKLINREKPDYVPTLVNAGQGVISYAKTTIREAYYDPEKFIDGMTKVFERFEADLTSSNGITWMPNFQALQKAPQIILAADGISNLAQSRTQMREDEYPKLIADPNGFVRNEILPRLYPELFDKGLAYGVEAFKAAFNDMGYMFYLNSEVMNAMRERYGIVQIASEDNMLANPIDTIFDYLRGFAGTSIDLRRRKQEVLDAIDAIWAQTANHFDALPFTSPYCVQPAHIPTYLSPKQFEQFFWPYEKEMLCNIAEQGGKTLIWTEGKWLHVLDYMRDIPKDCCILGCDQDDIFEYTKKIGDYQFVAGGAKSVMLEYQTKEQVLDYTKKVIDECAKDGGFLFCTDTNLNCPGNICENLFEAYHFVHEYGRN